MIIKNKRFITIYAIRRRHFTNIGECIERVNLIIQPWFYLDMTGGERIVLELGDILNIIPGEGLLLPSKSDMGLYRAETRKHSQYQIVSLSGNTERTNKLWNRKMTQLHFVNKFIYAFIRTYPCLPFFVIVQIHIDLATSHF